MSPRRTALALLAALLIPAACSGPSPLPDMSRFDSAQILLEQERYERARLLAEAALDEDDGDELPPKLAAKARFVAAEAALAEGLHLKAFRHYRALLETGAQSSSVATVEDRLFEIGEIFFFDDEYGGVFDSRARGVEVMETILAHFTQSPLADDALRLIGEYFASEEIDNLCEASLTFEQLHREYPESEWAERSLWLAGHYRLQLVDGPRYNQADLVRAHDLFTLSQQIHPRGVAFREVAEELKEVRETIALGEVLTAEFYLARENTAGERERLANAALGFPETEAGRYAAERLVDFGLDLESLRDPRFNSLDKLMLAPPIWSGQCGYDVATSSGSRP